MNRHAIFRRYHIEHELDTMQTQHTGITNKGHTRGSPTDSISIYVASLAAQGTSFSRTEHPENLPLPVSKIWRYHVWD